MNAVFIGGSLRVGQVNAEVAHRLDNIVQRGLRVLIGDAPGFDRAAQMYLATCGYKNAVVYCTAGECRNNVGNWPLHAVPYSGRDRGREFYTAKDDAMVQDADFGLFAWDGKSQGTLRNIQKMAERGKPSAVYVVPKGEFVTVRSLQDAGSLSRVDASAAAEELFSDVRNDSVVR